MVAPLPYKSADKDKNVFLLLSGLFFGLSICVKWTGFYAGIGLCILYFVHFFVKKKSFLPFFVKGCIFFVFLPLILYCSCFLLFPKNLHYTNNLSAIIDQNKSMYEYHSNLEDSHSFSSKFYSWPISYRPVWYYYTSYDEKDTASTISGVGNLVIWYMGLLSIIYMFVILIMKKDKICFFLLASFLCLWIPYMFIGRIMYLYHYFPAIPFVFLSVVYFLRDLECVFQFKRVIPIYLSCCFLFFVIYYPIVSGMEVPSSYISNLELFDSWHFN